jgi:hypothetical protein
MWVLPNRFYFTKWFYQHFHPENYTKDKFDPSQQLIKDFITYDSPYRGILVYHGLGVGKTASSILATDGFVNHHKKVVILLPSSLEANYRKELEKFSTTGHLLRKKWYFVELTTLEQQDAVMQTFKLTKSFLTDNDNKLWLPYLPPTLTALKESTYKNLLEGQQEKAKQIYQHIFDQRYTFLHYNGLNYKQLDKLTHAFEDAIVVIDEVHTFISRVVNGGKVARRLYNMLIEQTNTKFVLLSGTPVINHPFELCYTLNLLRGPITEYRVTALKDQTLPDATTLLTNLGPIAQSIDTLELSPDNTSLTFTLLPTGFLRASPDSVTIELIKGKTLTPDKVIQQLKTIAPISIRYKTTEYTALPDKKEQFLQHFLDSTDPLHPTIKHDHAAQFMQRIQGIVSYYRIADEDLFPKPLPPIYKNIHMSPHQFQYYAEVRNKEIKQDEFLKKKRKQQDDLFKTTSSYRAYSRMACNYVFPEEIPRPFPKDIKLKILRKELDLEQEDTDEEEEPSAPTSAQTTKLYEQELKKTLSALQQNPEYLTGEKLYQSSPKLHTLLTDLTNRPTTKSLLYSQFRTVEGLRLVKMVLEAAGWVELDLKKQANEWVIQDAKHVLDPKYDHKRFITFGDKEKTDMLINLFNADLKFLPQSIQEQLKTYKQTENLRGKLASLLMISQSGAEGLNLRNVRYVYILEPFWNQVRIDQVIGRAIRKRSHLELPPEERNVQVIIYLATLSPKQLKANKTLQFKDNGQTTDETILALATRKNEIIQYFLTLLKSNAVDCVFHAAQNKPLQHGYRCYMPPENIPHHQLAYKPNLQDDSSLKPFGLTELTKTIKGQAVLYNNKKYVKLPNDDSLYDYQAYIHARALMPSKF